MMLTLCFMNHLFIFCLFGFVHRLNTIVIIYLFGVCLKGFVQNQEDLSLFLSQHYHKITQVSESFSPPSISYQASTCHMYVWHTNMHADVFTVYINTVFVCID